MKKKFAVSITIGGKDKLSKSVRKGTSSLGKMKLMARATGRSLRKLGAGALRIGRSLGRMAKTGFIAVTGAIIATVFAVNKMADSMDLLAKNARSINFPIEEFQEWQFVAGQSGVGSDKFSKGMLTFNKRLGKLKGGFGPLQSALKKTNPLLAKQLNAAKDTGEAMDIMVNAIRDAKGSDMKSMLADAAFGLTKMSLLAENSAEALTGLRKEARENGLVTAKQAKAAEDYNDMMTRVKLTLAGLGRDALAPLMPKMTKLADGFREWINVNRDAIQQGVGKVFDAISSGAKKAIKWISENKKEIKKFGTQVLNFGKTLLNITKWAWKNKEAIIGIVAAIAAIKVTAGIVALIKSLQSIAALTGASGVAGGGSVVVNASKQINSLNTSLGKAGLVGAAAAAGVAIGLLITSLLNSSQDKSLKKANVSALESRGISKMSNAELDTFLAKQKQTLKNATGFGSNMTDLFSGRNENENLRSNAIDAMRTIHDEKRMRADRAAKTANMTSRSMAFTDSNPDTVQQMMSDTRPVVSMSQPQETVKKEIVELVIRDESGKAEVTRDTSGDGFAIPLFQSGAN